MDKQYEIGIVGLGVMGRNLLLNMADHGYMVAGYDKEPGKVEALRVEAEGWEIQGAENPKEFADLLRTPRTVMMLVPAGPPVDSVIRDLLPHLAPGDLIVDDGNSYFTDTELRGKTLTEKGIQYLGVGISAGEHAARHGPCLMPGGSREAYERMRPVFEAIAARVGDEPCVAYLGPGAAGHYVKMALKGIEHGLMELIAESYDLMKRGLGLSDEDLYAVYDQWNQSELNSYLVEISAHILRRVDEKTGRRLVDVILDEAKQKGTAKWAAQDALELQVPVPNIIMAVMMRHLSSLKGERLAASRVLDGPDHTFEREREPFVKKLRNALYAGMILTFAQGMALLRAASQTYGYNFNLEEIARIWRGGSTLRAAVLEPIREAYHARPGLSNLMMDAHLGQEVVERQGDLRATVSVAAELGIPAPGLTAALAYWDGYRSAWLPANLIQAQRDYFGAHTYERLDAKGVFHTRWGEE